MIYAKLDDLEKYFPLDSKFREAVSFALAFDKSKPDGRHEVDAGMYASVFSYSTSPSSERRFEAHRRYADLHIVLEGEESVEGSLSRETETETLEEYSREKDVVFLEAPSDLVSFSLNRSCFALFYPNELHRPGCDLQGKSQVRKIVMKILMD